ncbi:hypothetical protein QCA50_005463 [Cerrena zonata]|uniref:Uncharacterized protein n=1 Tax=Cerrena zonata TaxID=2478898 RepID=A0AAW0GPA2_9APHY
MNTDFERFTGSLQYHDIISNWLRNIYKLQPGLSSLPIIQLFSYENPTSDSEFEHCAKTLLSPSESLESLLSSPTGDSTQPSAWPVDQKSAHGRLMFNKKKNMHVVF